MRKFPFLLVAMILGLASCKTDFNIGADYRDVTVVYGLLSMSDTAHYVKVTKGFYDEKQNNLLLAKEPDSIYFSNITVDVQVLNAGNVVETINLTRVDLNLEGYGKEPGTFATTPNYGYKFKKNLDPNRGYRVRVKNLGTGKMVTGETGIISSYPSDFRILKPSDNTETMDFSSMESPFTFSWRGPSSAAFYDIVIRFKYQEVDVNTNDTIYVQKDVAIEKNIEASNGELTVPVNSVDFYKQLNSVIGEAPLNIKRYIDTPDLFILAGGQVLKTYIEVNSAQGGITFDQIKPNYTNLLGEDVFGIFSTRGKAGMNKVRFNDATIDLIRNGPYTKNLRIVGISTQ